MNGELAQLIALAAHGNAFLAGGPESPPELLGSNSTFQYVRQVEFAACARWRPERLHETAPWFERLRTRGVHRLAVVAQPDEAALVGFAGGGSWWLAAHLTTTIERWSGRWSVLDERPPDNRIWSVTYRCSRSHMTPTDRSDLDSASTRLRSALEEAEKLAGGAGGQPSLFVESFADARQLLESKAPEAPYHPDMLPANVYSLEARRLLAASTRAWVFGGMGSWNDVWFEEQRERDEYERVTHILFSAVLLALAAAANSLPCPTAESVA